MQKLLLLYFILVNTAAFILFTFDKFRSRVNASRVPEKRLHLLSLLGGFIGSTISMIMFRHKTNKDSFLLKHSVIIIIWIVGTIVFYSFIDEMNFLR